MQDKAEVEKLVAALRKKSDPELIIFRVSKNDSSEHAALADLELQRRARRRGFLSGAGVALFSAGVGALLAFLLRLPQSEPRRFEYFVTHAGTCSGEQFNPGTCQGVLSKLGTSGWRLVGSSDRAMYFVRE